MIAVIEVSVPVRICDNGGWTDTWFGGPGRVLNIAVRPGVHVSLCATGPPDRVLVDVDEAEGPYPVVAGASRVPRHSLVEAAIDMLPPPDGIGLEVTIRSAIAPGSAAGTSAATAVALLAGLSAVRAEQRGLRDIAYLAHRLEVDVLGVESGIQDQLSAVFGGINFLEIDPYPIATVESLGTWEALDERLSLVFLGRAHDSSGVHRQVIEHLAGHESSPVLAQLRNAAVAARRAVRGLDLQAFGRAMIANTEAQKALHPVLVGRDAARVIESAAHRGALGWKVNGAGGEGGSVTILNASRAAKESFDQLVPNLDPRYRVLPITIASVGLEVTGTLE